MSFIDIVNANYTAFFDNILATANAQLQSGAIGNDQYKIIIGQAASSALSSATTAALQYDLNQANINQLNAQTSAIATDEAIKSAQSDKDLLVKAAQIASLAKDLSVKDAEIVSKIVFAIMQLSQKALLDNQSASELQNAIKLGQEISLIIAQVSALSTDEAIKSAQSDKDLLVKDAQISLYNSQGGQFDKYGITKAVEALGGITSSAFLNSITVPSGLWQNLSTAINELGTSTVPFQ